MNTYVVKELGKLRKYCLFVVSSNETMRVANRSSVSCGGASGSQREAGDTGMKDRP